MNPPQAGTIIANKESGKAYWTARLSASTITVWKTHLIATENSGNNMWVFVCIRIPECWSLFLLVAYLTILVIE